MAAGRLWRQSSIAACESSRQWNQQPGALDETRIQETIASIPPNVNTILDAGCGNGWLSNRLMDRYQVVGLDYVPDALRFLRGLKARGTVGRLPFQNDAFDLVVCCETIEHLDDSIYAAALSELTRVSREYVLVTVPNCEDLGRLFTKCLRCGVQFSPHGHVRSFSESDLRNLFHVRTDRPVDCILTREIVPTLVFRQNHVLLGLRPERLGFWSSNSGVVCPQCGFTGLSARLNVVCRIWANLLRLANAALHPDRYPRNCWLLGLYRVAK